MRIQLNTLKSIECINILNDMECSIDKIIKNVLLSKSNIDSNYLVYQDYNTICQMIKKQFYLNILDIDYFYFKAIQKDNYANPILSRINAFSDIRELNDKMDIFVPNSLWILTGIIQFKVFNFNSEKVMEDFKKQIIGTLIATQIKFRNLMNQFILKDEDAQYDYDVDNLEIPSECVYNIIDNSVSKQVHILINDMLVKINTSKEDKTIIYQIYEEIDCIRNLILQKYNFLYNPFLYLSEYPDKIFYITALGIIQFIKSRVENRLNYYNIDYNIYDLREFKEACGNFVMSFEVEFSELREYICTENIIDDD